MARQFARSLCAERVADLLVLDALAEGEVRELLAGLARFDDPALEADVATHLHRHSGGSPLFLSELLDSLARNGVLLSCEGRWQIPREGTIESVPRTLGKLMTDRVDGLHPWMRACVEALAVSGQQVAVEMLARALDLSEPRTELALGVLEEERLVKRAGSGSHELIHDELRKLVYQGIPDERRRLIHQVIGLGLEGAGEAKRPGGSARLAFHFEQAGERERVPRHALAAAGEASALSSPESRQTHLELAEAHAPRALPPGRVGWAAPRGLRGLWTSLSRRHWAVIGAAFILLAVGAIIGGVALRARAPVLGAMDYRQGTIYLGRFPEIAGTHRLVWGRRKGELATVEDLPRAELSARGRIITAPVTADGETHAKVFVVRGKDTTQLTFGRSDDGAVAWAPDSSRIIVERGSRTGAGRYQNNLYVLDTLGRAVGTLTSGPYQDQAPAWSPTGTRLAFMRNAEASWSLWLADTDGRNLDDLTSIQPATGAGPNVVFSRWETAGGCLSGYRVRDWSGNRSGPHRPTVLRSPGSGAIATHSSADLVAAVYFGAYRQTGPWGVLEADSGVLVSSDGRTRRLPAPVRRDETTISGAGWTLKVAPGWVVREGARQGDYEVVKRP